MFKVENLNATFVKDIKKGFFKKDKLSFSLKNINFEINEGEVISLIGESGAGKTQLIDTIVGISDPESSQGKILFDQKEISSNQLFFSKISIVYQGYPLFNNLTVSKNIELSYENSLSYLIDKYIKNENDLNKINLVSLYEKNYIAAEKELRKIFGKQKYNSDQEIQKIIDSLNLSEQSNSKVKELSGGQRQRVAIAKALIKKPKLIIMDEPFSSLDRIVIKELIEIIKKYSSKGISFLITSHKTDIVDKYSDRFLIIKNGEIIHESKTMSLESVEDEYIYSLFGIELIEIDGNKVKVDDVKIINKNKEWEVMKCTSRLNGKYQLLIKNEDNEFEIYSDKEYKLGRMIGINYE